MGTNPMTPKLDMGRQLSSICLSVYHSTTTRLHSTTLPVYHCLAWSTPHQTAVDHLEYQLDCQSNSWIARVTALQRP